MPPGLPRHSEGDCGAERKPHLRKTCKDVSDGIRTHDAHEKMAGTGSCLSDRLARKDTKRPRLAGDDREARITEERALRHHSCFAVSWFAISCFAVSCFAVSWFVISWFV